MNLYDITSSDALSLIHKRPVGTRPPGLCFNIKFLSRKSRYNTLYLVIPASVSGGFQVNETVSLPAVTTFSSRQDSGTKTENNYLNKRCEMSTSQSTDSLHD